MILTFAQAREAAPDAAVAVDTAATAMPVAVDTVTPAAPEAVDSAATSGPITADSVSISNAASEYVHEAMEKFTGYPLLQTLIALFFLFLIAAVIYLVIRRMIVLLVHIPLRGQPHWWSQVIIENRVLHRMTPLVPAWIIAGGIGLVPHMTYDVVHFVRKLAEASIVVLVAASFGALLTAINEIYTRYPVAIGRPIKGYLQVVKVIVYVAAGVMTITVLLSLEPFWFISGLGAMTAVILLIFRDTLLSLVAGIQLVNNDLVRVGDWIEMPQFNADGDVIDISLNVVKVLNWDKTVTVIPTHKFLDHSFKNWRSMQEIGGRRIKRAIYIDMSTIRFLSSEEIERFSRFMTLKDYISQKQVELQEYNKEHCPPELADVPANSRHLTNIGTLRAYISEYLKKHPKIHKDMTFLIRQLAPTPKGLPLEVYVYTNDTQWAAYEGIQSDIFDHVLSIVPEFGLRVFQEPSGRDFATLTDLARVSRSEDEDKPSSMAGNKPPAPAGAAPAPASPQVAQPSPVSDESESA